MKAPNGLFGRVSGKLGKIIASMWKGIPYFKMAPEYSKTKKRSAHQLAHTGKFNFVTQLLIPFHPYLNIGFKNLAINTTEISVAFSIAFRHAVTGVYPNLDVDYSRIEISRGDLPMIQGVFMESLSPDTIKISWMQNVNRKAHFDDQLMLVAYCPELKVCDGFYGGTRRSEQESVFTFHQKFLGKVLEIYVSMTSADRKKIADSLYLGRITPQL